MTAADRDEALRELERAARKVYEIGAADLAAKAGHAGMTVGCAPGCRVELVLLLDPLHVRCAIVSSNEARYVAPAASDDRAELFRVDVGAVAASALN